MIDFDLPAFMSAYRLTRAFCAKVFGVCERTISRWCRARRIPRLALQLVRTIERQCAPWNASFVHGWRAGAYRLDVEWRDELFAPAGGVWQDYRSPEVRALAAQMDVQARQHAAEHAERIKRVRLAAGRKAAATRRAAAELAARDDGRPSPGMACRARTVRAGEAAASLRVPRDAGAAQARAFPVFLPRV